MLFISRKLKKLYKYLPYNFVPLKKKKKKGINELETYNKEVGNLIYN